MGDNVGDIAGMGSDIFESYCGSMIACIAIASTMALTAAGKSAMMAFPLALASIGLLASVAGILIVRARSSAAPEAALRSGTLGAPIIFITLAWFLLEGMGISQNIWWAGFRRCGRYRDRTDYRVLHRQQAAAHHRKIR